MDELDIDPRLVNEDGDFTPAFEAVLIQMFKRFDVDQDGVWSLTELQEFAKATNGAPFNEDEVEEIQVSFDCNDKQELTQKGLFEMYFLQSTTEPEETWKDMDKLGYTL